MLRGMDIDQFGAASQSFFFNAHNEFFEEICKLRAARRIWATAMMRDRYGAKNKRSWFMKHARPDGGVLAD